MSLLILIRDRQEEGQKVIECSIENFVRVVAVTKQQAVPSSEFSPATGNLEREAEVEDAMLDLLKPLTEGLKEYDVSSSIPNARNGPKHVDEEKPLDDKLPSVVPDAGRDTLAKDTKSKKGIIGSQPRGNHTVFTHYPKGPNCEVCKKTTNTSQVWEKPRSAWTGLHLLPNSGRS